MFKMRAVVFVISLELLLCVAGGNADEFALQDGDTVVFLGDSITAARTYGEIVENYTLLRYPQLTVTG